MILIRLTLLGKVANDNADSFMEFYCKRQKGAYKYHQYLFC